MAKLYQLSCPKCNNKTDIATEKMLMVIKSISAKSVGINGRLRHLSAFTHER